MKTQHKAFGILAAVLAAGLLGTAKPAAASGLTHPIQFGQQTVADHDGDWNYDGDRNGDYRRDDRREEFRQEQIRQAEFRRQQEIRREEERRREEWQRDHRDRYDDHRDRYDDHRDRYDDHRDRHGDSLQIVIR